MQSKTFYPERYKIRPKTSISNRSLFSILAERLEQLVGAETYDHVIGRFAFGPLLIRIPGYACAQILAMTTQLHILVLLLYTLKMMITWKV